ncbi:hypothetical protein ACH5RR_025732 [Cinchona calisaya]|uniref:Uncharacterized protein n=1 Tax=Cinchona calisaya TaxID=153742 RepID=A0ABD2Z3U9_9GENT
MDNLQYRVWLKARNGRQNVMKGESQEWSGSATKILKKEKELMTVVQSLGVRKGVEDARKYLERSNCGAYTCTIDSKGNVSPNGSSKDGRDMLLITSFAERDVRNILELPINLRGGEDSLGTICTNQLMSRDAIHMVVKTRNGEHSKMGIGIIALDEYQEVTKALAIERRDGGKKLWRPKRLSWQ